MRGGLRQSSAVKVGVALSLLPASASAHTEDSAAGFISGLTHPIFGVDHFLAMLGVGVVSALMGGHRIYTIPALFMFAMVCGAVGGILGHAAYYAEYGIALSVLVIGVFVGRATTALSLLWVVPVVMFFGSLHGNAHGLEMPQSADPVYYAGGFLVSTALIHMLGVGVGHLFSGEGRWRSANRYLGIGMAVAGLALILMHLT
jgi:urease accessory protein